MQKMSSKIFSYHQYSLVYYKSQSNISIFHSQAGASSDPRQKKKKDILFGLNSPNLINEFNS